NKPAFSKPKQSLTSHPTPAYPKDASNLGIEGNVKLAVDVSKMGDIEEVTVLESADDERLNRIAKRTIEGGWEFKPADKSYQIELIVKFKQSKSNKQVKVDLLGLTFTDE
ncbi:MAG: energy transducer TonB, partial [Bacillota bacterium]